jgi:hypothetical protein
MGKMDLDMEFDFGFSAIDENAVITKGAEYYKDRLLKMHKMITPLVNNLLKDSDKPYIHWADREAKLKEFKAKIDALVVDIAD